MPRKKKKEAEPVEAEIPEPKKGVIKRAREYGQKHEKTLWRSFITALIGVFTLIATNGDDWVKAYFENQKAQGEKTLKWQQKAEARHQIILSKLDTMNLRLTTLENNLTSKTKIK